MDIQKQKKKKGAEAPFFLLAKCVGNGAKNGADDVHNDEGQDNGHNEFEHDALLIKRTVECLRGVWTPLRVDLAVVRFGPCLSQDGVHPVQDRFRHYITTMSGNRDDAGGVVGFKHD